jgi:hypothetical protein
VSFSRCFCSSCFFRFFFLSLGICVGMFPSSLSLTFREELDWAPIPRLESALFDIASVRYESDRTRSILGSLRFRARAAFCEPVIWECALVLFELDRILFLLRVRSAYRVLDLSVRHASGIRHRLLAAFCPHCLGFLHSLRFFSGFPG